MAKYRKKPVEVEAIQFAGENNSSLLEWTGEHVDPETDEAVLTFVPLGYPGSRLWVAANESWVNIEIGEWIIKDARGFYPCKPDIFEATYEPVA